MVGLHSSDPVTVFLAARARVTGLTVEDVEDALYERRSLLRMLGMRRTMFVQTEAVAEVMDAACTRALGPPQRRALIKLLENGGVTDDGATWIDRVSAEVLASLSTRGEATARELTEDVPELAHKISYAAGKSYAGLIGVSTRILFLLATESHVVRARPRGSWLSSQYRWALTRDWIGRVFPKREAAEARADLARLWLTAYGPGTTTDLKWWTGWGVRDTRAALETVDAVEVDLDDGTGWILPGDLDTDPPPPWVGLLPSLDPTTMGWKEREWYLGSHRDQLFDVNGNAGPTVWVNGRVVGGWAIRKDGTVAWRALEDIGTEKTSLIDAEAGRLELWLGDVRPTPRFRTPIDRELSI
ncbi:MAG: winged helix DNA-binding domain-containing protein [Acidimicrobiia bacterium]|nr:winged helix DNA-binding domain-containing protein [Acidimicrobiia bacterium]